MFTSEIDKILRRNTITSPFYIGCFAADQIPNASSYPFCVVVNLDPQWADGSHWIALYVLSPSSIEYYDSLAMWPPPSLPIFNYLLSFKNIRHNKTPVQSSHANTCGKHVIFFLFQRCSGMEMDVIIKKLRKLPSPDRFVNEYVQAKIFNNYK
jgi:hypothetical protein